MEARRCSGPSEWPLPKVSFGTSKSEAINVHGVSERNGRRPIELVHRDTGRVETETFERASPSTFFRESNCSSH